MTCTMASVSRDEAHVKGWQAPDFRAEADAWIRAHAPGDVLAIEQPHVRSWATALRVETSDGVVWFKANSAAHRQEAEATSAPRARSGRTALPELLAHDRERGWMLMRDAGEPPARARRGGAGACAAGSTSSRSTRGSSATPLPLVDELLAVGVPRPAARGARPTGSSRSSARSTAASAPAPRRAHVLAPSCEAPRRIRRSPRRSSTTTCTTRRSSSATAGILVTRLGRRRASAHPFFSMSVTLQGVIAWGVDDVEGSEDVAPYAAAYLEPWGDEPRRRRWSSRSRWAGRAAASASTTTRRRSTRPSARASSTASARGWSCSSRASTALADRSDSVSAMGGISRPAHPLRSVVAAVPARWKFLAALWTVYLVWGSTYLAIKVSVRTMPAFLSAGSRFLLAGALLARDPRR